MNNSKIHKALKEECEELFITYLNGELQKTTDEIENIKIGLSGFDINSLRIKKEELLKALDELD